MTFAARLISSTLGLLAPRYRTIGQWAVIYRQVVDARPISDKSKANRRCSLAHVLAGLGGARTSPRCVSRMCGTAICTRFAPSPSGSILLAIL